jgi:hypothetical protein
VVRNDLGGRREKSLEMEINIIYEIAPESRKIFMMNTTNRTDASRDRRASYVSVKE